MLDASSVRPDVILLLDTFFYVIVFHGETIAAWRDQRYQDDEHVHFRMPLEDNAIMSTSLHHRRPAQVRGSSSAS